jgi:predicted PurR-regulated permease PerM
MPRDNARALIRYALVGLVLTAAIGWTLYQIREAILLIYVSALLAIGLAPLVTAIERSRVPRIPYRLPRGGAILVIYFAFIGVLVGLARLVFAPLVEQARALWSALPQMLSEAQQWLIDRGLLSGQFSVREAVEQAPSAVTGADAVGTVLGAIWGLVGGVFGLVTILILAFYLLLDSENIVRTFVRLFPKGEQPRVEGACRRVTTKVSGWVGGQILLAAIIGSTAALGLYLLGVPYFYVLALVAAIGEMIPIVGPLLAAIPAVAVAFSVSPTVALGVAVFFIAQQQFENHVLVPKVMERQVGVSAAVVIVSLLVGGSLLGIMGAILAVPTAAILQVLFEELGPSDASE